MIKTTLDATQVARFQAWLSAKSALEHLECYVCTETDWRVSDHLFVFPSTVDGDGRGDFARTAPFMGVVCNHCGYTLFFNALSVPDMFD